MNVLLPEFYRVHFSCSECCLQSGTVLKGRKLAKASLCGSLGEIVTQLPPEGFLTSFLHHCWRLHGELDGSLTLLFVCSCVPYTRVLEMLQPLFPTSQFFQGVESCYVGISGGSGDSPNLLSRTQISSCEGWWRIRAADNVVSLLHALERCLVQTLGNKVVDFAVGDWDVLSWGWP